MKKGNLAHRPWWRQPKFDMPFFFGVILLLVIGLATVYSASFAKALQSKQDSYYFIIRQLIFAGIGLAAMFLASWFPYRYFRKLVPPIYVLFLILLVVVYFVPTETERRWIYIGSFQFQPSEVAKVAVLILMAAWLSKENVNPRSFLKGFVVPGIIFAVPMLLVLFETHLSGAILIACIGISIMLAAGCRWYLVGGATLLGAVGGVIFAFTQGYMTDRLTSWGQPEADAAGKGYQALQSLYAIGSGGLTGLGYGESRQKYMYLPEPQNDFIFSIFCEEMGWIAAVAVMGLFCFVILRGLYIAKQAPDKFSSLIVIGIMTRLAVQTIFNICVVSGVFPVTGISLPFFSYGGTALVVLLGEMGIVLHISRYANLSKDPPLTEGKNKVEEA